MPRLTASALFTADGLAVRRVTCDGVDGARPKDEGGDDARIILVSQGRFTFQDSAGGRVASPVAGLFLPHGHMYRIRHVDGGDVCVSVQGHLCGLLVDAGPAVRYISTGSYVRVRELVARLQRGEALTRLAVEETLATALSSASIPEPALRGRDRSIAEAIAYHVEHDLDARLSLTALAHKAGVSAFHACRVFKRVVGRSIHRYQQDVRLRHALAALLETDRPIAGIAAECGFANQGHLTNLFRRRYHTTPGRVRRDGIGHFSGA